MDFELRRAEQEKQEQERRLLDDDAAAAESGEEGRVASSSEPRVYCSLQIGKSAALQLEGLPEGAIQLRLVRR